MMWMKHPQNKSMFRPKNHRMNQAARTTQNASRKSSIGRDKKTTGSRRTRKKWSNQKSQSDRHPQNLGSIGIRNRYRNGGFLTRSDSLVKSDQYIITGSIIAATSKKRKHDSSSADESYYFSDIQHENSRPSKNTSAKRAKLNLIPAEGLPLPKTGTTPLINMILYWGENEADVIRVLLDMGVLVAILSEQMTRNHRIPVASRPNIRQIQDYAGQNVLGAGEHFTSPLLIRHNKHFDRVSFEIAPLAKEYDAILPCWRLAKHKFDLLANNSRIKYNTEHCRKNCTMNNHENFSLE